MTSDNWDGGIHHDRYFPDDDEDPDPEEDGCTNPEGHEWTFTGTSYGGEDSRWFGEGRCYCRWCGADGDG